MATFVRTPHPPQKPVFAQYAITATATALSATAILGDAETPRKLTIKNADGAANICYLGSQAVTATPANAGVELGAGDSYTFDYQSPTEIFIIGTANAANIAFITAEY